MFQATGLIYNTFVTSKKKERFAIILEPLQALLQLALLSFTPIDSKLNIYNNILYIQTPTWNQSLMRSYNNDSKNDLFFLFNVFIRFNKFYLHLKDIKDIKDIKDTSNSDYSLNLFMLLKQLCNRGIDNLLQTYKQTDNPALLHTLNIYKNMLNNNSSQEPSPESSPILNPRSSPILNPRSSPILSSSPIQTLTLSQSQEMDQNNLSNFNETSNATTTSSSINIDTIFISITKLYTEHDLIIIFHTLLLLSKNPSNYVEYIEGLNKILEPINKQIQKWIVDNIVY